MMLDLYSNSLKHDTLQDSQGSYRKTAQQKITGGCTSVFKFTYTITMRVLTSEHTIYLAIYTAIVLFAFIYHYIGMCYFFPQDMEVTINVAEPIIRLFTQAKYIPSICSAETDYIEKFGLLLEYLILPMRLFGVGIFNETLEYIFEHLKLSSSRRKETWIWMLGSLWCFVLAVSPHTSIADLYVLIVIAGIYALRNKISTLLSVLDRNKAIVLPIITLLVLVWAYMSSFLIFGTYPIIEYFKDSGMTDISISKYEKFFEELNIDISRVFVMKDWPLSSNALTNGIPFKSLTAVFIGKNYISDNSSFEELRGILLHELGHIAYFDTLIVIVALVLKVLLVYTLLMRFKRTEKESLLKSLVILGSKIILVFLVLSFISNILLQLIELRADRFSCSADPKSCAYLSKFVVEQPFIFPGNILYNWFYPRCSPFITHPSPIHRLWNIQTIVSDAVYLNTV